MNVSRLVSVLQWYRDICLKLLFLNFVSFCNRKALYCWWFWCFYANIHFLKSTEDGLIFYFRGIRFQINIEVGPLCLQ
uniref:Uncharacterized protein n=1 Tax=Aegilops tauschii subsp. strangulata TaxID=200361 RepID=A0A453QXV1_AEGTS